MRRGASALLIALAASAPAAAQTPDSLAQATGGLWTLQSDREFAPEDKRWRYEAPKPRAGFSAQGAAGDLIVAPGLDYEALSGACFRSGRGLLDDGSNPAQHFWYFQSGDEGLLLVRTRTLVAVEDCKPRFRHDMTVQRLTFGKQGYQLFTRQPGGGYSVQSRLFSEDWHSERKDIVMGSGYPLATYFALRKQHLSDSNVGAALGKLRTHCVAYSSPPDAGGQQCWIGSRGPSQGLITYDMSLFAGSPMVAHKLDKVENGAIDGRLFEWDRDIRPAAAD
ncbi:hypothetical protein [Sphingopyxis sp.]|uniref:hypothetical protein n=1 Tax=Sphingopyxis sp. TaxID=1908224 RepID=UPI002DEF2A3A|nr:hypothetical protein [Sphingopyxis sp.]